MVGHPCRSADDVGHQSSLMTIDRRPKSRQNDRIFDGSFNQISPIKLIPRRGPSRLLSNYVPNDGTAKNPKGTWRRKKSTFHQMMDRVIMNVLIVFNFLSPFIIFRWLFSSCATLNLSHNVRMYNAQRRNFCLKLNIVETS